MPLPPSLLQQPRLLGRARLLPSRKVVFSFRAPQRHPLGRARLQPSRTTRLTFPSLSSAATSSPREGEAPAEPQFNTNLSPIPPAHWHIRTVQTQPNCSAQQELRPPKTQQRRLLGRARLLPSRNSIPTSARSFLPTGTSGRYKRNRTVRLSRSFALPEQGSGAPEGSQKHRDTIQWLRG